jgi:flagellar hook assembly protein FlgD
VHGSTLLRFRLDRAGEVRLDLYSSEGRRLRTLAHGAHAAGEHAVRWNGRDDRGEDLPAGVYLVGLSSRGASASRKLIWLGR